MTAESANWRIAVDGEETSAVFEPASTTNSVGVLVCAHGAGGHMADRGMARLAEQFRTTGLDVVRFNFLYRERKSSRPDRMPRLKACVAAVAARTREEVAPRILIIGGRSMGGRAASMLCADGFSCDGLLLLAYPLHPPGRFDQMRDAHLPAIGNPVLCFNGTRDDFCRRDLMEGVLKRVKESWTMRWLEGADHSFHVLKSSGRTDEEVLREIGEESQNWISPLGA